MPLLVSRRRRSLNRRLESGNAVPICVFKLGGSCLTNADWPSRLRGWLRKQPPAIYIGIVGGGELIEALRDLDRIHRLNTRQLHWRCIRLLDATFEIAVELVSEFAALRSREQLAGLLQKKLEVSGQRVAWLRIASFYNDVDVLVNEPMPSEDWSTTTDTLALLLARELHADRCVLLKSCPVDHLTTLQDAVDEGIVDPESIRFGDDGTRVEFVQL